MEPTKEDTIAAKREARRRKLLENAKDRLTRITGREHNEDIKSAAAPAEPEERIIYPDPEIERDVYVRPHFQSEMFAPPPPTLPGMNAFDDPQSLIDLMNSIRQEQENGQSNPNSFAAFAQFGNLNGGPGGANPLFANLNTDDTPKVPETRLQKFLKTKLHIGILSILTYLLITLTSLHCNVFLIFLIWEITEIFLLRQHENNPNGIVNILFMLAGTSPAKINILLKWIQLLNKVLRDVAIFIFFFVLIHICYMSWNGLSLTPAAKESILVNKIPEIINVYENNDEDVFEQFDL